jgi:hypothetical protein
MATTIRRPAAITKLSEAPRTGMKNWLVYGDSGIGKTVFAGSAPNSLFLTVEAAGTESAKEMGSGADEWVTSTWADLQDAYKWLKEDGGAKAYEWLLIDSISEVEEACWRMYLDQQAKDNTRRSIYRAELQDYNVVGNMMRKFVDQMNRLPMNVLYTALPMAVDLTDPLTEEDMTKTMPQLGSAKNGRLSQKVAAQMTLVGMLNVVTPKRKTEEGEDGEKKAADRTPFRRLALAGNSRFLAKTRHHKLGKFVDNPNVADMVKTIEAASE